MKFVPDSPVLLLGFDVLQIASPRRREVSRSFQAAFRSVGPRAQMPICLAQDVETLLRRNARKEADREYIGSRSGTYLVAVEVDPEWNHVHLIPRHLEVIRHKADVILADRQKRVDRGKLGK